MKTTDLKQPVLKPQDLFVVLKVAVTRVERPSYAGLAHELFMSASEVHAGVQRAVLSHLLEREQGVLIVNRASLREFLLCGVRYAFPAMEGPVARGLPTGVSAPPFHQSFEQADLLPLVWPDIKGEVRGVSVCPLYPTVPAACRQDPKLYHVLTAFEALRGGRAREREFAKEVLIETLA